MTDTPKEVADDVIRAIVEADDPPLARVQLSPNGADEQVAVIATEAAAKVISPIISAALAALQAENERLKSANENLCFNLDTIRKENTELDELSEELAGSGAMKNTKIVALQADQTDWRKGVGLIASAAGVDSLCCVKISDAILALRSRLEAAEKAIITLLGKMKFLGLPQDYWEDLWTNETNAKYDEASECLDAALANYDAACKTQEPSP